MRKLKQSPNTASQCPKRSKRQLGGLAAGCLPCPVSGHRRAVAACPFLAAAISGPSTTPTAARPVQPEAKSPQDVPENAGLQLKRLRTVVLVVSRGHHDNKIELRDDAIDCPPRPSAPAQWTSRPLCRSGRATRDSHRNRGQLPQFAVFVEASIHAFETIWRSLQRHPQDKLADFAISRGACAILLRHQDPPDQIHSTAVMPRGSNNSVRANSSRGRPVALRMMADTSVSAPVL